MCVLKQFNFCKKKNKKKIMNGQNYPLDADPGRPLCAIPLEHFAIHHRMAIRERTCTKARRRNSKTQVTIFGLVSRIFDSSAFYTKRDNF